MRGLLSSSQIRCMCVCVRYPVGLGGGSRWQYCPIDGWGHGPRLTHRRAFFILFLGTACPRGQAEPPSLDLSIEHHLSGGDRRSSSGSRTAAARRCSRQGSHEGGGDASERGGRGDRSDRLSRWSGSTSRLALIGGPGRTSGLGLAEREVRGEAFNQDFKSRNKIKEKGFF
jgi:hypothetical protein